jgi:hypothetical protein
MRSSSGRYDTFEPLHLAVLGWMDLQSLRSMDTTRGLFAGVLNA